SAPSLDVSEPPDTFPPVSLRANAHTVRGRAPPGPGRWNRAPGYAHANGCYIPESRRCRHERQGGIALEATPDERRVCAPQNTGRRKGPMRLTGLFRLCTSLAFVIGAATTALAQSTEPEPEARQTLVENAAGEKAQSLHPYEVTTAEKVMTRIEKRFTNQTIRWHPYLENGYRGGGFAAGLGYMFHPSAYSTLDVRGSYSIRSYKLAEAEFVSPRLFDRRAELTVRGGWRDATEVAFYGVGMHTSTGDRANYGFEQ